MFNLCTCMPIYLIFCSSLIYPFLFPSDDGSHLPLVVLLFVVSAVEVVADFRFTGGSACSIIRLIVLRNGCRMRHIKTVPFLYVSFCIHIHVTGISNQLLINRQLNDLFFFTALMCCLDDTYDFQAILSGNRYRLLVSDSLVHA